jgi:hypothetical protein
MRKERGVEGGYLDHIYAADGASSLDPLDGFRVMKGCELGQFTDRGRYARIDRDWGSKTPATMDDPVSDRVRRCG